MYKRVIRIGLIAVGALILASQVFSIISNISNLNFDKIGVINIVLLIIGYYILITGIYWKNILKKLTRTTIFFSALLLTIGIGFQVINTNSDNIVNSLQPTIDYITASLIIQNIVPHSNLDKKLTLIIGTPIHQTLYNANLTEEEANNFLNLLGIKGNTETAKKIITAIETYIENIYPEYKDTYIPVDILKQYLTSLISIQVIEILPIDGNSKIKIAYYKNSTEVTLNLEDPDPQKINLIWNSLGLCNNVSTETKIESFSLMATQIISKLPNENTKIPLSEIKKEIPSEVKQISCIDLFNKNISVRASSIRKLRELCNNETLESIKGLCNYIQLTDYNNLMNSSFFNNNTQLSPFKTIEGTREYIKESTSYYTLLYILSFSLLILSLALLYGHYKLTGKEADALEYIKEISRSYTINLIPTAIAFYILKQILTKNLQEIIAMTRPQLTNNINIISSTPLFITTIKILENTTYIIGFLGIISGIVYLLTYLLEKKKKTNNTIDSL